MAAFDLHGSPGDYLLFFGRIHPDKGTVAAIDVAERAGLPLVMAGIVQDEDYFERRVKPRLDGERVRYVGPVGPEARGALLGGARALLHLIEFEEPFGYSVVEAMACGTPVIANARGSMPEIVRHGVGGFLVGSVDEAVAAVAACGSLDRAAVRASVERRFDVERMVDEYLEVYQRVVADHRARMSGDDGDGGRPRCRLTPERSRPPSRAVDPSAWASTTGPLAPPWAGGRTSTASETARDLGLMADRGLDSVRIFLTWEAFQPAPDRVDAVMLERLVTVADLAEQAGVGHHAHALHRSHERGEPDPRLGAGRRRPRPALPGALRRSADGRGAARLVRRPGRGRGPGVVRGAGRHRPGRPPGAVGMGPGQRILQLRAPP